MTKQSMAATLLLLSALPHCGGSSRRFDNNDLDDGDSSEAGGNTQSGGEQSGGEGGTGGARGEVGGAGGGSAGAGGAGAGNAGAGGAGAGGADARDAGASGASASGAGAGGSVTACEPGERRCERNQPQICVVQEWINDGEGCANAYTCNGALGTCESTKAVRVIGGSFYRSNDSVTSTTAYPATVSAFGLDKLEVTVERFRSFVNAVVSGWVPGTGSGKHAHLNDGSGLKGTTGGSETGWNASWNEHLLGTKAEWDATLNCGGAATWKAISGNENKPLNCVNWYQSYAYCIWDGGFLPSETEWNYATAGGAQQRFYAWSIPSDSTRINVDYAVYLGAQGVANGGSKSPLGDGRWLQSDLIGNLWEWTLDLHQPYADQCDDCANTASGSARVIRGGGLYSGEAELTSSHRSSSDPTDQLPYLGFRCARSP